MELELDELIWDSFNTKHIAKHNLSQEEVAQACVNQEWVAQAKFGRLMLLGKTSSSKLIAVVLQQKSTGKYYPVTARAASRKERRLLNEKNK